MHIWSIFGACTSHGQTQTHHGLDLGETITFPLIVFSMPSHGASTQMSFCLETPKLKSQNSLNWGSCNFGGPIIFCVHLWLRWGLKQSCSTCQDLSNGMWNATYTQGNQGDSWLLVVGLSFGHKLCFKYPNGSCKPILNIYVLRTFQWYKELLDPMSFDFAIALWRFRIPLELQLPKWELT